VHLPQRIGVDRLPGVRNPLDAHGSFTGLIGPADEIGSPVLEACAITHSFGRKRVLDGVSVSVQAGDVVAIVGENGAGMSTLMPGASVFGVMASNQAQTTREQRRSIMPDHKTGTREEWQAARDELAKLEAEQAKLDQEVAAQRRELPWVPVEKEYRFDTDTGKKTLSELFDGRSQLLAYNIMFGPDYELGACPGCSNLGDELDSTRVHLNHRDVTLICFSRAPIERLTAYKERMGWQFPYVSTYGTDFAFDFGLALTPEQAQGMPEIQQILADPPEWLQDWGRQVGAQLEDGLREGPGFIAFALDDGRVYHTYTVTAPDPFVAPYHAFLLKRTPKAGAEEPRAWRKDEYPA
jgi:predicted dithiol-disulfide oxidoreductase (DUF899 family)